MGIDLIRQLRTTRANQIAQIEANTPTTNPTDPNPHITFETPQDFIVRSDTRGEIKTIVFDETNLPDTCHDYIMMAEEQLGEHIQDEEGNIVFVFPTPPVSASCLSKHFIERTLQNPDDNIFYECGGPMLYNGNRYPGNTIRSKPYVKLPIQGGVNGYLPLNDVHHILDSEQKIFYIVPLEDEHGVHKMITHSVTHKNAAESRIRDYVSTFHCQAGTNIMLYTVQVCDGDGCVASRQ